MYFDIKIMMMLVILCSFANGGRIQLNQEKHSIITKFRIDDWRPDGYSFEYETSAGASRKEHGYFKKDSKGNVFLVTEGEFSYLTENNEVYKVSYIADENGYQPKLPQKISEKMSMPNEKKVQEDVDFSFPDENFDIFSTRDSTKTSDVSTTESPAFTEDYPFITTLIPDENGTDLGDRFSPGLVGSLLGK